MGDVAQLFESKELTCNKCLLSLPVSEFSKNSHKARGYKYSCKKCSQSKERKSDANWRDKYRPNRLRKGTIEYNKNIGEAVTRRFKKLRDLKIQYIQETGLLTCAKCEEEKPLNMFQRDRRRPTGYKARCKSCSPKACPVKASEYYQKNKATISRKAKWYRHKTELNFSEQDYYELLAYQEGACAICKRTDNKGKHFHIDHNHSTGEVRGLLCKNCNNGIGMLGDNVTICRNAAKYLEERGTYGA